MRPLAVALLILGAGRVSGSTDCNRNGIDDDVDVRTGSSQDCNTNLIPDECDILPINYGVAHDRDIAFFVPPNAIVVEDLDQDGITDVFVAQGKLVTVLWNDGYEDHETRVEHPMEFSVKALGAADLEGDGDPDIVLLGGGLVSFLRNDGERQFTHLPQARLPFEAGAHVLGDFDLDGDLDLAGTGDSSIVLVPLGGEEPFVESQVIPIGSGPVSMVGADLDRDGDLDLATGNLFENVSILLNEKGSFGFIRNYAAGGLVKFIKAADMDGDRDIDLVAVLLSGGGSGDRTSVLRNLGRGSFELASIVSGEPDINSFVADDLDADGDIDVALMAQSAGILLNHGGVLGPPVIFRLPDVFLAPLFHLSACADLERDGSLDLLVTTNRGRGKLSVLERIPWRNSTDCNGDSIPDDCQLEGSDCNANMIPDDCDIAGGPSSDCNSNATPDECERDCNLNGIPDECDLTARTSTDCNANSVPDDCDVRPAIRMLLSQEIDRTAAFHESIHAADLDLDGDNDIITRVFGVGVRTLLNRGVGTFEAPFDQFVNHDRSIAHVGDMDGDGDPDLLLEGGSVIATFLNDGKGGFTDGPETDVGESLVRRVASADLDADGDLDVLFGRFPGEVTIYLLSGSEFEDGSGFFTGDGLVSLHIGDFDSDGDPDAVAFLEDGTIRTFFNDGTGRFLSSAESQRAIPSFRFQSGDFDGDGDLDLAEMWLDIRILFNQGDGRFAEPVPLGLEESPDAFAVEDLDGDGDLDIAVTTPREEDCGPIAELSIHINDGAGGFRRFAAPDVAVFSTPTVLLAADLDGDRLSDIVALTTLVCPCCEVESSSGISLMLNRTVAAGSRNANRNLLPDECEGNPFRRGDPNADGKFNLADPLMILGHLFRGSPSLPCAAAADAEDDGRIDLSDAVYLLGWLFTGGPPPLPPGPTGACGYETDPSGSPETPGCSLYDRC